MKQATNQEQYFKKKKKRKFCLKSAVHLQGGRRNRRMMKGAAFISTVQYCDRQTPAGHTAGAHGRSHVPDTAEHLCLRHGHRGGCALPCAHRQEEYLAEAGAWCLYHCEGKTAKHLLVPNKLGLAGGNELSCTLHRGRKKSHTDFSSCSVIMTLLSTLPNNLHVLKLMKM